MISPQQKSMDELRSRGFIVESVEHRKQFPMPKGRRCPACGQMKMISYKADLFNCFDIFAVDPHTKAFRLVQTTTGDHHADRKKKILDSAEAKFCRLAGIQVVIMSWRKRKGRWVLREESILPHDFPEQTPPTIQQKRKSDFPPGVELPFTPMADADFPF